MINDIICHYKGHKFTEHIVNLNAGRGLYQCTRCKIVRAHANSSYVVRDYVEKGHKFIYSV
jgi:hypothetical protein